MCALRRSARFGVTFTVLLLSMVLLVAFASHVAAQSNDAFLGKWRLNVAKSKFSPGPAPRSSVVTYAMNGNCLTAVNEAVDATGTQTRAEFTCLTLDGRDYPVKGSQAYDSSAYKRVDALTTDLTRKKAGKVVETGTRVLSKDGKTLTFTLQGTDAKGQKFSNVAVHEKQ